MTEPFTGEPLGGARLLTGDAIITWRLMNEAYARGAARLFGVPKDKSLLVTLIAAGAFAGAIHSSATRALSRRPSVAGGGMGAVVLREGLNGIGGPAAKTPFAAPLIAFAVLGASYRPLLRGSFRTVMAEMARIRAVFGGRYGSK